MAQMAGQYKETFYQAGNQDGKQNQRNIANKLAHNAANRQNRNKRGKRRQRGGSDWHGHADGTTLSGGKRCFAALD